MMDRVPLTDELHELKLAGHKSVIAQNVGSTNVLWCVDKASSQCFILKPLDTLIVDYNIWVKNDDSFGESDLIVGWVK